MSYARPLNFWFRAVRLVGVRACLEAFTESPLFCYYHVNLRSRRGFDLAGAVGAPAFLLFLLPWTTPNRSSRAQPFDGFLEADYRDALFVGALVRFSCRPRSLDDA